MAADEALRTSGIVGHPNGMRVGAEVRAESRTQLGQNASLAAGERPLAFVDRKRAGAEHWIVAEVIDRLKDRIGVDFVGDFLDVGRWNGAVG